MPLDQDQPNDSPLGLMSFGAHLDELRKRLIRALIVPLVLACVGFALSTYLLDFVTHPLLVALAAKNQPPVVQVLSPSEMVVVRIQLSIWGAVILAVPWILWQAWRFVAPGLYHHERRYARFLVPLSTILVLTGLTLFYLALPLMLEMLMGFADTAPRLLPVTPAEAKVAGPVVPMLEQDPSTARAGELWMRKDDAQLYIAFDSGREDGQLEVRTIPTQMTGAVAQQYRLSEYVDFVLFFGGAIAIAFQTPVAVLLLGWLGILDTKMLRKYRRHALFICAIAAAVITPTVDLLSMVMLMVPLYALYELGIVLLQIAPARAVSEGGVMRNALAALLGRSKYHTRSPWTDGDEGDE